MPDVDVDAVEFCFYVRRVLCPGYQYMLYKVSYSEEATILILWYLGKQYFVSHSTRSLIYNNSIIIASVLLSVYEKLGGTSGAQW